MPAGVIDISKYAMADRSQRVLVRTTAALPTPARTTNAPASLYRAIRPSGVSRKIQFGKSARSAEERSRQSAAAPLLFPLLGFPYLARTRMRVFPREFERSDSDADVDSW